MKKAHLNPKELAALEIEQDRRAHDPQLFKFGELVQKITINQSSMDGLINSPIAQLDMQPDKVLLK
jgi:hypothetical protein